MDAGDADRACSTAYYAMFYAARAALIHVGRPERAMGKTHTGLVSAFSEFLVKPGLLEPSYRAAFAFELNRRISADYDADGVDPAGAVDAVASAQAFVAAVRSLIDKPA